MAHYGCPELSVGRPGVSILAPSGQRGGPWEQQEAHGGVRTRMTQTILRVLVEGVGEIETIS